MTAESIWSEIYVKGNWKDFLGGIRYRQKQQAPTPQALVRNRQTRKVANAKACIG